MQWNPKPITIVKSPEAREVLKQTGFLVAQNIGTESLDKLREVYFKLHNLKDDVGGVFYSLYSTDLEYRRIVHNTIGETLYPLYDSLFEGYKSVINSFIVKVSGPESEFSLHQDSSGLDELNYSALSVWIPLQDTDLRNGCLCVVPKSHKLGSPFRGITIPQPFEDIETEVRQYLQPIFLKAGDVLIFDNRLIHFSPTNDSGADRVVVMSGLFPKEASIEICYRDNSGDNSIEVYRQSDDYLLTNTTFFHDCTCRPVVGEKVREINMTPEKWSKEKFLAMMEEANLYKTNIPKLTNVETHMHIFSEPI